MTYGSEIGDLFSIVLSATKDRQLKEAARNVQEAFHELIQEEAASRRVKSRELILAMARIDRECKRFEAVYRRVADDLSEDARDAIESMIRQMKRKRRELAHEKEKQKTRR